MKQICHIGPIIKHINGYGFKLTFKTTKEAQQYKQMNHWIIEHDGYKILNQKGYNENKEINL